MVLEGSLARRKWSSIPAVSYAPLRAVRSDSLSESLSALLQRSTSPTQKAGMSMRFPFFEHFDYSRRFPAFPLILIACLPAFAQQTSVPKTSSGATIRLDRVRLVIGMPGLPPNLQGTLQITSKTLRFNTPELSAGIERDTITKAAVGEEVVETGGTIGFIARKALPYSSGAALGAVTHKKVGLLSIEFRDSENKYHGVVFALKPKDIAGVEHELSGGLIAQAPPEAARPAACLTDQVRKDTVRLAPIQMDDASLLPEEYRVLVYEQLIKQLQGEKSLAAVYRDGDRDPAAQCAEFSLTLQVKMFKKGNPVLRASTGPLGAFLGTTSLSYHLTARTPDGIAVIDKDMKSSERKDTDSLNVAKMMSGSIAKNLKKAEKLRKSQMS
jgi:hypothetical protein